jgi:hypothetical protein
MAGEERKTQRKVPQVFPAGEEHGNKITLTEAMCLHRSHMASRH